MRISCCLSVIFLLAVCAAAQPITGVVVDTQGSAIREAEVSLLNRNTSVSATRTDVEGEFFLEGRITSDSRLVIIASGFSNFELRLRNEGVRDFLIVLQPSGVNADVTVSITRTETRLNETPASVVALSREDLDQTASQAIDDSLRQIAGFTLFRRSSSRTANPTTHGANLRGVSGSGASRAAVLFDGLSLNDAFGGWTYWSRVPQVAVERAELLRGGASSLYGSGGLSGAINLVRTETRDGLMLRAQASAGSQNTFDGSVFGAFARDGWAFDLAAEAFRTRGYIPVVESERGLVDTYAGSEHENVLFGIERRFENKLITGRLFARGSIFAEDRENGTALADNATHFRQAAAGSDVTGDAFGRVELRGYVQSQVYDQTFSGISADRNTEILTRLQRVPSQATGASVFWTRAFGEHTVAASFEFRDVRGYSDEVGIANDVSTSVGRTGGRERTLAVFVQDFWRVTRRVIVTLGGRYDGWKNHDALAESRSLSTGVIARTLFPDRTLNALSPRAAVIFTANERLSFYGSYSGSFRAPTLNELYRSFRVGNVVTQANENLRPELANTLEGGFSLNGFQRRAAVRANVFVATVTHPIISVTLSSTPTLMTRQRQNVGETRSQGLELDAEFAPSPKLRFTTGYLFVDARVTEFPSNPVLVGQFLPQVARHQLAMQLNYRPVTRWSIGLQTRASSVQFEDELNSLRLRPYFTVDTTTAFRLQSGLEIFVAVENVFNSRYDIGLTPNRSVASPTFARVGLRFDFSKR